jgi:hypothetical protein
VSEFVTEPATCTGWPGISVEGVMDVMLTVNDSASLAYAGSVNGDMST